MQMPTPRFRVSWFFSGVYFWMLVSFCGVCTHRLVMFIQLCFVDCVPKAKLSEAETTSSQQVARVKELEKTTDELKKSVAEAESAAAKRAAEAADAASAGACHPDVFTSH